MDEHIGINSEFPPNASVSIPFNSDDDNESIILTKCGIENNISQDDGQPC